MCVVLLLLMSSGWNANHSKELDLYIIADMFVREYVIVGGLKN